MQQLELTPAARAFVEDVTSHHPRALVPSLRGAADPVPAFIAALNNMVEEFDVHVQWMNEDDPESMVEVVFDAGPEATFEAGARLGFDIHTVFDEWCDAHPVTDDSFRILWDNADELAQGDRIVRTETGAKGTVQDTFREDENEPRSLMVQVDWDDCTEVNPIPRMDVERA